MAFLDVTKAYDKAWLDAIMYVMHKEGLTSPEWEVIRKMNEDITATIMTKYGMTREIKIKDSIRQGGVLSVAQYTLLMDEINKEITENKLGTDTTWLLMPCWGGHQPKERSDACKQFNSFLANSHSGVKKLPIDF